MVRLTQKLKFLLSSLAGRLILGMLLVHTVTLPIIFSGIMYIVRNTSIELFQDGTRVQARMIADTLETMDPKTEREKFLHILDSAVLSGQVVFAEFRNSKGIIRSRLLHDLPHIPFNEDLNFGQHRDTTYFMSLTLTMTDPSDKAILRLGFDEHDTHEDIAFARKQTIVLITIYVLLTSALVVFLSQRSIRLLRQLGKGSRRVVSGHWHEHLNVSTKISDILELANDLEEMRRTLVEQSTNAKRSSRMLHDQQIRLIESEAMATVGEMAPVVAHNIRNPLASIRSSAELISDENTALPTKQMVFDIMSEVDRLDGWIREFLLFSRSRDSNLQKTVNLDVVVKESLNTLQHALQKDQITVVLNLNQRIEHIFGDAVMLKEMLNCVINNSLDAIQDSGQITISTYSSSQQQVTLSIQDTGIGISKDKIEHIYKPFNSSKKNGLGLGLLLVKRIVENHGGNINISSALGIGTTIQLSFPSVSVQKTKVLIIEDDPIQACAIEKYLNQFNYIVSATGSLSEAIDSIDAITPNIVLLELNLPGSNTQELLTHIKVSNPSTKVIIISGHNDTSRKVDEWKKLDSIRNPNWIFGILLDPLILGDIKPIIDKALFLGQSDHVEDMEKW